MLTSKSLYKFDPQNELLRKGPQDFMFDDANEKYFEYHKEINEKGADAVREDELRRKNIRTREVIEQERK